MNKSFLRYFVLILALSFTACNNDDDGCQGIDCLPATTQNGEDTLGCLVDGKTFIAREFGNSALPVVFAEYGSGNNFSFTIGGSDNASGTQILIEDINRDGPLIEGTEYSLGNNEIVAFFIDPNGTWTNSDILEGYLYISKLDEANQIISGTFSFRTVNEQLDYVDVTDGRFDIRYN